MSFAMSMSPCEASDRNADSAWTSNGCKRQQGSMAVLATLHHGEWGRTAAHTVRLRQLRYCRSAVSSSPARGGIAQGAWLACSWRGLCEGSLAGQGGEAAQLRCLTNHRHPRGLFHKLGSPAASRPGQPIDVHVCTSLQNSDEHVQAECAGLCGC
jgi:hypothetical protein